MIFVDADGFFSGTFKKTFQEILFIQLHIVARVNHKVIMNQGFCRHLNKVHNINSADKVSLHQCFQGVFLHFTLGMQSQ